MESFEEKLCFPNSGKDEKPGPAVVAYAMPLFFGDQKRKDWSLGGLRFGMDSIHHIWILQVRSMDAKWPSLFGEFVSESLRFPLNHACQRGR